MKSLDEKLMSLYSDLVEKHFPKNKCKERGNALVLVAELYIFIKQAILEEILENWPKKKGLLSGKKFNELTNEQYALETERYIGYNLALDKALKVVKQILESEKMNILMLQDLKDMRPGTIFAKGETIDSPEGINMINSGKMLRWLAVRGGIHDWAIYCHFADKSFEWIRDHGDKVHAENHIRKLCPCNNEAFEMYRH